jgi:hypothetical protein
MKKTSAQLDREIAEALAKKPVDQPTVQDLLGHMSLRGKTRVEKTLMAERQRLYEQLGYAGNTRDDVRRYSEAIEEINAKMKLLK